MHLQRNYFKVLDRLPKVKLEISYLFLRWASFCWQVDTVSSYYNRINTVLYSEWWWLLASPIFKFPSSYSVFMYLLFNMFCTDSVLYSHFSELLLYVIKSINSHTVTVWPNLVPCLKTDLVIAMSFLNSATCSKISSAGQSILTPHLKKGFAVI